MAHDKRRTPSTDMNDIDLHDAAAMTDQERAELQQAAAAPGKPVARKKKAM